MISPVADASQVAASRRLVGDFAQRHGLPDSRAGALALVVTELATNLLKHGGGGEILADTFEDRDGAGIEVLALDRGAGMADVERCAADGYSTAGSPGNGLGAIARQSDQARIYSRPGLGTAVMARFVLRPANPGPANPGPGIQFGAIAVPYPGELVCGDRWAVANAQAGRTVMLADGSGHGVEAARAADLAARVFHDHMNDPCENLMERIHRALTPTRGAAVAIARIDPAARIVRYVGLGNISGLLASGSETRHMISYNGTAGHVAPRIRAVDYPYNGDPMVMLHSDGLTSRWDLATYPGLAMQHPSLVAGVLFRDFRRARDDASVVVMRVLR